MFSKKSTRKLRPKSLFFNELRTKYSYDTLLLVKRHGFMNMTTKPVRKSAKTQKPSQRLSKVQSMLTVFSDYRGIVYSEFLPTGQIVYKNVAITQRSREKIRHKKYDSCRKNCWILHHDNTSSHTSLLELGYLTTLLISSMSHHNRQI